MDIPDHQAAARTADRRDFADRMGLAGRTGLADRTGLAGHTGLADRTAVAEEVAAAEAPPVQTEAATVEAPESLAWAQAAAGAIDPAPAVVEAAAEAPLETAANPEWEEASEWHLAEAPDLTDPARDPVLRHAPICQGTNQEREVGQKYAPIASQR